MLKITECPRDAMQGIKSHIPTELKAEYLNLLLRVGFNRLDFGSFVSPKAIPQMSDTAGVLKKLELKDNKTELLAIVANLRGAQEACSFEAIRFLGFPFSISETFQQRNTNASIAESLVRIEEMQRLCIQSEKKLQVYISMAFGNPYGDEWSESIASDWCKKLHDLGINHIALADTTGSSDVESITKLFTKLIPELKNTELSAHLHSTKEKTSEKIKAAYDSGCRSFDTAIHGFGGCPMAKDELTGNVATQALLQFSMDNKIALNLDLKAFEKAAEFSWRIFNKYH
jgi:hydroxymethylglutaryl-CoA lyase